MNAPTITPMHLLCNAQARTLHFLRTNGHAELASCSTLAFQKTREALERRTSIQTVRRKTLAAATALLASMASLASPVSSASTLDLEISAGFNITDKFTGRFSNTDGGFTGPRDTVEFSLVWRSTSNKWFVKLSHISHLSCGFPFGECKESQAFKTVDGFSVPQEAFLDRIEFGRRFNLFGGF